MKITETDLHHALAVKEAEYGISPAFLDASSLPMRMNQIAIKAFVREDGYKQGSRLFYSDYVEPQVYDFAQKMANIWCPARAFVLDVFRCDGQLYVGEINCFNAAGFYALNVGKMVEAIENMEFKEST